MKKIILSFVLKFEHATELKVELFNNISEAYEFLDNNELNKWIILHKVTEIN